MLTVHYIHRQQNMPTGNGISTILMSSQKGKGYDQFCTCDTCDYPSTHTVDLPSVPKVCDIDPVCKAVCTL